MEAVRELVGYAAKFDYQMASDKMPKSDLPALKPFLRLMLTLNNRQVREDDGQLSFKTPDAWLEDPAVRPSYDNLIISRSTRGRDAAQRVVGVGHRVFDQALQQAKEYTASITAIPQDTLPRPLVIFSITDQVTTEAGIVRSVIAGVEITDTTSHRILHDWELLDSLNEVLATRGLRRLRNSGSPADATLVKTTVEGAQLAIEAAIPHLELPFKMPIVAPLAVLWPAITSVDVSDQTDLGEA